MTKNKFTIKSNKQNRPILDGILTEYYLKHLENDPKPKNMSQSLYITYLTLKVLEKFNNKFPTQAEIDTIEIVLTRISRRKLNKNLKKNQFDISPKLNKNYSTMPTSIAV